MLDHDLHDLIARIHASGRRLVLEFTGAGSQALFWLHAVAGSSRTVLEAADRYAAASLADLLGGSPEQSVSAATASAMALAAYRRALRLSDGADHCVGVACSAAISTDRARRGANRCSIALRTRREVRTYSLVMTKGIRDRAGEEALVSRLILRAIAEGCGLPGPRLDLVPEEHVEIDASPASDPLLDLVDGTISHLVMERDGSLTPEGPVAGAILSGSFNPLHAGHELLAEAARAELAAPATFELSVVNADKPPLSYAEVDRRLEQFRGRHPVALSRAPLFVEKAALYPGCAFVVGYDTALRLVDARYYGGEAGRDAALAAIAARGCRFLVAGRLHEGAFRTLADLPLPDAFAALFLALPAEKFRADLSSTELRARLA